MQDLINRSYQAIVERGLITPETTWEDFNEKIKEEFQEMQVEYEDGNFEAYVHESLDLVATIFNFIKNNGWNPINGFEDIVLKNEERAKNHSKQQKHDKSHKTE